MSRAFRRAFSARTSAPAAALLGAGPAAALNERWAPHHGAAYCEKEDALAKLKEENSKLRLQVAELQSKQTAPAPPAIFRIVITGGPCAGKTTSMAVLRKRLENMGWRVFLVPEAATMLFHNGARFLDFLKQGESGLVMFQVHLAQLQMRLEHTMHEMAAQSGERAVVLCDRGVIDGKAYCTPQAWSYVLNELGQSEAHLRDRRYDAVIHLVTAANGAEKFYTLEQAEGAGASARTETLDEARQQDQKTVQAWVGHEHFYVLENNTNFERKINRAVDRVLKAIGEPVTGHCLRKIRLPYNKVSNIVEAANAAGVQQCQVFRCATTYISDSSRVRMRSDLDGKGASFYMQLFDEDMQSGRRRRQRETKIDSRDYIRQMKDAHNSGYNTVEKELVCFHWNGVIYEVNIFHWPEEVCILEVEAESHNEQIHVPSFLEAVGAQEVTHDRSYDTRAIARRASREMLSSRPS
mmetsp:Transcript_63738/g.120650  ORF Transcript_63738/g.120650 Transcript_63738/m.120650 type:complete len:466 (-) Transcript_63738:137-1534(-)